MVAAGLSFVLRSHILIISTAFVGSYGFIRGISFYAGGYPNEFTLYDRIKHGLIENIEPTFYAYFASILVLFIIGLAVQYRMRNKEKDDERHPYYNLR